MAADPAPVPRAQAAQSWTSGAKDLVMTALGTSRVWATTGQGILNEVYWPAVDQPQVKDLGFLVGGSGWWQEVKRAGRYTLSTPEPGLMLPTIVHTGTNQAYQLTLRPVVDPAHDALLIGYDLAGAGLRLYPLLAPHLGVSQVTPEEQWGALGAANQAWVDPDPVSGLALFASGNGHFLCLLARPGFALPAGRTLVVAGPRPFTLHYGFDDWDPATITERDAQGLGLGLSGVALTPADLAGHSSLQFVRRYPDGRWEPSTRHDVTLGAPGPGTVRLSADHLARLAASGGRVS